MPSSLTIAQEAGGRARLYFQDILVGEVVFDFLSHIGNGFSAGFDVFAGAVDRIARRSKQRDQCDSCSFHWGFERCHLRASFRR
jgi:hypothetical protein